MGKPVIPAKEVLTDMRAGLDDAAIMKKYKLSAQGLQSLIAKLVSAGLLDKSAIDGGRAPGEYIVHPLGREVSAKEVVSDLRNGLTDDELMSKYRLSARGLQDLYEQLLQAKLITHEDLDVGRNEIESTVEITPESLIAVLDQFEKAGIHDNGSPDEVTINETLHPTEDTARTSGTVALRWICRSCGFVSPTPTDECPTCGAEVQGYLETDPSRPLGPKTFAVPQPEEPTITVEPEPTEDGPSEDAAETTDDEMVVEDDDVTPRQTETHPPARESPAEPQPQESTAASSPAATAGTTETTKGSPKPEHPQSREESHTETSPPQSDVKPSVSKKAPDEPPARPTVSRTEPKSRAASPPPSGFPPQAESEPVADPRIEGIARSLNRIAAIQLAGTILYCVVRAVLFWEKGLLPRIEVIEVLFPLVLSITAYGILCGMSAILRLGFGLSRSLDRLAVGLEGSSLRREEGGDGR